MKTIDLEQVKIRVAVARAKIVSREKMRGSSLRMAGSDALGVKELKLIIVCLAAIH